MGGIEDFEKLFRANYRRFVSVSYSYTSQTEVAEEVVQDVFADYWNRLKRNEKILNGEAYLRRAVVYRSLDVIKKERKHTEKENEIVLDQLLSSADNNPEELIVSQEKIQFLEKQIASLPEKTKQIFMLSRFEKMNYQEIADQTDIKVKTVEYHISKALSVLRKALYVYVTLLAVIQNIF